MSYVSGDELEAASAPVLRPTWTRPELKSIELGEVSKMADLEVAFTTACSQLSHDL